MPWSATKSSRRTPHHTTPASEASFTFTTVRRGEVPCLCLLLLPRPLIIFPIISLFMNKYSKFDLIII